jgi:S-adenosylmethionine hydrolase
MRPIVLFTDYGERGPYVGQVKVALLRHRHHGAIIDLMADAPAFRPQAAAYLLASLLAEMPAGAVMLCVVDPGVGGSRPAVVVEADGRLLVGPDNGLMELVVRRAHQARAWRIDWRPERLSASFHGRDLFAPIAAALAAGRACDELQCSPVEWSARPDWPDDLPQAIYVDGFGNVMTGLRGTAVATDAHIVVGAHVLSSARTFSDRPAGEAFWYINSIGLVELAVNAGRADICLQIGVGTDLCIGQNPDAPPGRRA